MNLQLHIGDTATAVGPVKPAGRVRVGSETIEASSQCTWIDSDTEVVIATSSGQNWKPAVRFCQKVLGEDKVMFGADYPFEDQPASVNSANAIPM